LSEWFDTFFDALAHDVWEALVPDAASDVEAAWLADRLALAADRRRRLLDVPAGRGRLACRLAERGHLVTAVDFAPDAITPLAAALAPGSTVTPLLGDMRDLGGLLPAGTRFDGAYCMGNSFGYLDADDTARFLAGVAGALTAGAPFVVDAATVAESLLPHLDLGDDVVDRHAHDGAVLTNRHRYDIRSSTLVTAMTLEYHGERAEREARHRVMTCREVVDALADAGFVVERIDGDTEGHEFVPGSPRCLVTAIFRGHVGAGMTP
jgi:SAM-dependent methyltransferase